MTNPEKQDLYATEMLVADLEKLNEDIFNVEQLGLYKHLVVQGPNLTLRGNTPSN